MIQFQPAQDVKDALTGKKPDQDPNTQPTPQDTPKEPLAMTLSQNPKLAGIFKNSFPGSTTAEPEEAASPQPTTDTTNENAVAEPTPDSITTPSEPAASTDVADSPDTAKSIVMKHDPTDPHGVHDTAHPDEPPPFRLEATVSEAHAVPGTAAETLDTTSPSASTTQPQTTDMPSTPTPEVNKGAAFSEFQKRLEEKIAVKRAQVTARKDKVDKLLTETAAEQKALKGEEAELTQLTALRDLSPDMLRSVLSVAQEPAHE